MHNTVYNALRKATHHILNVVVHKKSKEILGKVIFIRLGANAKKYVTGYPSLLN